MKRFFVYLALLAVAGVLGAINYYLINLQANKQKHIANLKAQVERHLEENKYLNDRNDALRVEVDNLRSPDSYFSYEAKAREDYGLIGSNETFFVFPQEELKTIPDIEGLIEEKSLTTLTGSPAALFQDRMKKGNEEVPLIPVSPVPLQLESLQ